MFLLLKIGDYVFKNPALRIEIRKQWKEKDIELLRKITDTLLQLTVTWPLRICETTEGPARIDHD